MHGDDSTNGLGPRGSGRPRCRAAAAAMLALLAVGCGGATASDGESAPRGSSGGDAAGPDVYVRCMREHGVPSFPAPIGGRIRLPPPEAGVDPASPEFRTAERACRSLAPQGLGGRDRSPRGDRAAGRPDWRAFTTWLRRRAAADQFSGAVLVSRNGRAVVRRAYGPANRRRAIANTTRTRFNIGSIGKTFTAVAIAQLVQQGRLSFDDPVARYVSGLPASITIAQLLTHTGGLGDVFARWHPTASPLRVAQVMRRIIAEPLRSEPGAAVIYSNSGFVVLGAIIEAITGRDYYDYVRDHVFRPAGMTHTGWYTVDQVPGMAHGYIPLRRPGRPAAFRDSRGAGGAGNPSGGAYSTLADLSAFMAALHRHRLLGPALTKALLTGRIPSGRPGAPPTSKLAYGFEEDRLGGVRVLGHGGGAPGIEAQLRSYPALGCTVVVLANLDRAATPVYDRINQTLGRPPATC